MYYVFKNAGNTFSSKYLYIKNRYCEAVLNGGFVGM